MPPSRTQIELGRATRRRVLGEAVVDRVYDEIDDIQHDQQDCLSAYAWGDIFVRDGLAETTRMLINIAALTVLGERETLKLHVRAAARLGCDRAAIREAIMQAGTIAGGVRASLACRAASEALAGQSDQ